MPAATDPAQRQAWIDAFSRTGDAAAVCARFGISRPTLRKWWARHQRLGPAGLEAASAAPHTSPQRRVFEPERAAIRDLRAAGLSLRAIRDTLAASGTTLSLATIRRALPEGQPSRPSVAAFDNGLFDVLLPDDAVFRALTERITGGALRPGDPLDLAALARRHGAGRRQVRAALRSLAAIGLATLTATGATVAAPPVATIADAYDARRLVETEIARRLAARLGPADIATLRAHLRRQADAERRGDKVSFVRLLTDFHLLLAAMTGNAHLAAMVRAAASITALGVLVDDQAAQPSAALDEHRALVRCLEARDADGAARLMAAHLTHNHGRQCRRPA